ncbi:MAG: chemotaxis protein CheC [Thermoleophilaceae bacterium]|nr:chemotaxis protein CheC [Thermoleophilaceae bacterium]
MNYDLDTDIDAVAFDAEPSLLGDEQRDTLGEVAKTISAEAADAFSKIVGRKVGAKVPRLDVLPLGEAVESLGGPADAVTAAWMSVVGQIEASVLLLFDNESEATISELLEVDRDSEMGHSALAEIANIIGTKYVNGIAASCGMTFEPEPPEVASGMLGAVLGTVLAMSTVQTNYAVVVDTELKIDKSNCTIRFLFIPSDTSVETLISSLGTQ